MRDEHKKLLNDFLEEMKIKGYRMQTLKGLKYSIPVLLNYLETSDLEFHKLKLRDAQGFLNYIVGKRKKDGSNYSHSYISELIISARSFFNFLKNNHLIYTNPFLDLKLPRKPIKLPKNIYREKEMNLFLKKLCCYDEEKGLKSQKRRYKLHVIAELMYSTGLRINEVCNLKVSDIDFQQNIVNVTSGKGGIERKAFLNEYASFVLKLYIEEMRDLIFNEWNEKNNNLFGLKVGVFEKSVNKELNAVSVILKLPILKSHGFRHAVGFHLLRSGCDVRHIQGILGHRRLKSTEIYTKVEKEDLKKVFDNYHPRKFK